MSPFAAFRRDEQKDDFVKLADEHMQHDLTETDRDCLRQAAGRISTPVTVGTVVGLGLGIYTALRLRRIRADMFRAFRAAEKPTHVVFAGGRTEPVPDVTPYLQPTRLGDIATYFFFGLGGTILGGELGLLVGSWSAARLLSSDADRKSRIETAYRKFKADWLRHEAKKLDGGASIFSGW